MKAGFFVIMINHLKKYFQDLEPNKIPIVILL